MLVAESGINVSPGTVTFFSRIESNQREHKAVGLYELTTGMEFQKVFASLAKAVNHILKKVLTGKGRTCKSQS